MLDLDLMRKLKTFNRRIGRAEAKPPGSTSFASGTYTPTYLGGTTPGTTTYTLQDGGYVQIGQVVLFHGVVVWSNATGTGNARISLPFTSSSGVNDYYSGSLRLTNVTFANSAPEMMIDPATSYFTMDSPLTNANPTKVAVETAGNVVFSGFYFADTAGGGGGGGGGGGTVTSVGLTMPAEFSVAGSPITTSGTLAVTKANENANTVWAGPTSGAAAAPTFRALVPADTNSVTSTSVAGVLFTHFFGQLPGTAGPATGEVELINNSNGGYDCLPVTPPTSDSMGVIAMASHGASGAASAAVYHWLQTGVIFGTIALDLIWRFRLNALPASGQDYKIVIGFADTRSATPTNGAFLFFDFAGGFTKFRYRTRAAGVQTDVDSGLVAAANTWYKLQLQVDIAGNVIFTIDGANSQTLNTNVPSGTGQPVGIMAYNERVSGTNNRITYLDYCRFEWSGGPS